MQAEYRKLAEEYLRLVKEFFGDRLVSVCFYGSVAKGTATPESDVDVLVVAQALYADLGSRIHDTTPIHEALRRSEEYRKLRMQGISAFVSDLYLSPEEARAHPPILLDLTKDASIAYDKDGFFECVLEEMRRRLIELGAKRVNTGKGHYWILKPDANPNEVVEV